MNKYLRIVVLCTLSLCVFSCGLYSKYDPSKEPAVYTDSLLSSPYTETGETLAIDTVDWHDLFTDPALQALIDTALVRNLDLRIAHEHVEQAQAGLLGAKLAYLPSIQLVPQAGFSPQYSIKQGQYDLVASASWEIDIFGRTLNSLRGAKAAKAMTGDYEQAARCGLIAGVASTYYTLLMLDAQLAVAQTTDSSWAQTVETIRSMKEAGMANEAGVRQLEANYYAIRTAVLDFTQQIATVENALNLLLARPCGTPIRRDSLRTSYIRPSYIEGRGEVVSVPVSLLYNRPDVRAAQNAMAQAHYARQLATANCLPSLSLSGLFGWTNHSYNVSLDPMTMISNLAASLFVPVFQSGRNIAQVRAAKSQQEESRLNFAKTVLAAGNEVNEALIAYQTTNAKEKLYAAQVDALSKAHEATSFLMQFGSTTYLEVLTAQNTLLNAQYTQIANLAQERMAVVALYHALGGGRERQASAD